MICPDTERTRLLKEQTNDLSKWLDHDNKTEPKLAYWLPKYILMRGDKPFSAMGDMSNKMREIVLVKIKYDGGNLRRAAYPQKSMNTKTST